MRPIEWHTEVADVVYEPFSGSGTQIIAAERLSRRCFAMDIEPSYVDVAVYRWEAFTGPVAEKLTRTAQPRLGYQRPIQASKAAPSAGRYHISEILPSRKCRTNASWSSRVRPSRLKWEV
jgi:hypothetical protein